MEQAFTSLNNAMCFTLVPMGPDFSKPFVLEYDASRTSLGVVLTLQESRPLSNKKLFEHNLGKYSYEIIY